MLRWDFSNLLKKYKIKTVLDIGANAGQFAYYMRHIDPTLKITCVEPNPYCISKLNKMKNRDEIFEIYNIGLGDKKEILNLLVPSNKTKSKGGSFYKPTNTENIEFLDVEVEVDTLDNLFLNKNFDLVKIDTQGFEYQVIKGGKNFLKTVDYVIIEYQTVSTNENAPESSLAVKELEKLGFFIEDLIEENDNAYLKRRGSVHLDLLFVKKDSHNLDCVKKYERYFNL
jgi:FkbM family methyltransferase